MLTLGYPQLCRNIALIDGSRNATGQPNLNPSDQILEIRYSSSMLNIEYDVWALPETGTQPYFRYFYEARACPLFICNWVGFGFTHNIDASNVNVYDNAPGGNLNIHRQIADNASGFANATVPGSRDDHCFVPSVSSIDLDRSLSNDLFYNIQNNNVVVNGFTPFDAIYSNARNINTEHVTLEQGLQSTWVTVLDIIEREIQPNNLYLQNENITSDKNYEALNTITVGNNVDPWNKPTGDFVVSPGATVEIRAGTMIRLLPGTTLEGNVSAYIDPTIRNCSQGASGAKKSLIVDETQNREQLNTSFIEIDSIKKSNKTITEQRLNIYPNPANDKITINYSLPHNMQIVMINLHNVYGQTIDWIRWEENIAKGNYSVSYNVSKFTSGVYYCTLRTETIKETFKIIMK